MEELPQLKQPIDPTRIPMWTQNSHPINSFSKSLDQFYSHSITHQSRAFHSDGGFAGGEESTIEFLCPPSTTHEEGEAQKEIQDLSSTVTSELGSAKFEELSGRSVLNNQGFGIGSAFSPYVWKNFAADRLPGQGHVGFRVGYMEMGNYYGLSNSRYVKAAQELLDEMCCVGRAQFKGITRLTKNHNSNTDGAGITFASSFSSKDQPPLQPLLPAAKSEYQRRKVNLRAMLDEILVAVRDRDLGSASRRDIFW